MKKLTLMFIIYAGIDFDVTNLMSRINSENGVVWSCNECFYQSKKKSNVTEHIESKHLVMESVTCQICFKQLPNRKSLRNHMYSAHREFKN